MSTPFSTRNRIWAVGLVLALVVIMLPGSMSFGGGGCSTSIPDGLNPVSMQGCIQNSCQSLNETVLPFIQPIVTQQGCQVNIWNPFYGGVGESDIFNQTSDRVLLDFNGAQQFLFCIHFETHYNVISGAAFLRPEYSTDGGVTWLEIAATTTQGDIPMIVNDGGITCNNGLVPANLVSGIQSLIRMVRVAGFGGNGQEGYAWSFLWLNLYSTDKPVTSCGMTATTTTAASITCARTRTTNTQLNVATIWSCTQNAVLTQDGTATVSILANTQSRTITQAIGPGFTATPNCLADPASGSVLGTGPAYVVQSFFFTL